MSITESLPFLSISLPACLSAPISLSLPSISRYRSHCLPTLSAPLCLSVYLLLFFSASLCVPTRLCLPLRSYPSLPLCVSSVSYKITTLSRSFSLSPSLSLSRYLFTGLSRCLLSVSFFLSRSLYVTITISLGSLSTPSCSLPLCLSAPPHSLSTLYFSVSVSLSPHPLCLAVLSTSWSPPACLSRYASLSIALDVSITVSTSSPSPFRTLCLSLHFHVCSYALLLSLSLSFSLCVMLCPSLSPSPSL